MRIANATLWAHATLAAAAELAGEQLAKLQTRARSAAARALIRAAARLVAPGAPLERATIAEAAIVLIHDGIAGLNAMAEAAAHAEISRAIERHACPLERPCSIR